MEARQAAARGRARGGDLPDLDAARAMVEDVKTTVEARGSP
jgi:hypothetical protein